MGLTKFPDCKECGRPSYMDHTDSCSRHPSNSPQAKQRDELQFLRDQVKELKEQLCRENQCGTCTKVRGLEDERDEAFAANEIDRCTVADGLAAIRKALKGREWLRLGRGSFEYDDDRWRDEFSDAFQEILDSLGPLKTVARDIKLCPADQQAVNSARLLKVRAEAAEKDRDHWKSLLDEVSELKADAVRFKIHLEQKDRALKANAEEYRRLQAETKKIAIEFYYWWHNQPGTNTEQGFDEWWVGREEAK